MCMIKHVQIINRRAPLLLKALHISLSKNNCQRSALAHIKSRIKPAYTQVLSQMHNDYIFNGSCNTEVLYVEIPRAFRTDPQI